MLAQAMQAAGPGSADDQLTASLLRLLRWLAALAPQLAACGWPWRYREMDPDVFGEELEEAAYRDVDRIAAVTLVVQRQDGPMALHRPPARA